MEYNNLIQKYLSNSSWRKRENANTNESFSNMQNFISSNILANDFLSSLPFKHRKAHQEALIHIHNLESGGYVPYCCGHNLKTLIMAGMKTMTINSRPAKHLDSLTDQIMNWLFCSQQEFAGAQSFSDFDTLVAPFVRKEKLSFSRVKQQMQKLVYNLNMTMRSASQTPFTNLSLNYGTPRFLKDEDAIVGGESSGFKYSDCLDEIYMVDRALNEVMLEKDPNGVPFTFPILTINLSKRFDWKSEEARLMAVNASDVGSYYWMNYIGSGISEDTIRSMCCRLNIDMSQLSGPSGLWNTGEGTGSLGVVTINFPRLGFDSKGKDEKVLFEKLEDRLEMALYILNIRKERIKKYFKMMMPFNMLNGWSMRTYYITIGVIGLNEMCLNYLGTDITKNIDFVVKVLEFLREWSKKKQEETKQLINVEMIPGEGASYRLAYVDRKLHQDIVTLGTNRAPYYSALLIPPSLGLDILDRLPMEEKVLPLFTGGTIFRVFLGEKRPEPEVVLDLLKKISNSRIPYFDLTSTYSVCKKEGKTFRGVKEVCPECKSPTEIFSRVVGYYRPVSKFNIGKVEEFKDRKYSNLK
jgi:ribonucleoside-triphosphate reductase